MRAQQYRDATPGVDVVMATSIAKLSTRAAFKFSVIALRRANIAGRTENFEEALRDVACLVIV